MLSQLVSPALVSTPLSRWLSLPRHCTTPRCRSILGLLSSTSRSSAASRGCSRN